jgi:hypothetical protein
MESAPVKKTPLEMAIAEKSDRRLRYDKRMREGGNTRLTLWSPDAAASDVRELGRLLMDGIGAEQLRDLLVSLRSEAQAKRLEGSQAGGRDVA